MKAEKNNLPECSRFDTSEVIVLRDTRQKLSLAVKAGHNNEYHNHNDVGSYVLLLNDMLVNCDPGLEAYTSRTFSKRRYESDLLNSRGHAVPLVAGRMQGTGKEFKGKILKYSSENGINEIVIDLKPAYDVDGLEVLERKIVFNRKKRVVSVCDTVKFKSHSKFGTALITYQNIDVIGNDKIIIKNKENSVAVNVSATGGRVNIKSEVIKEKPGYIDQQPFRVGIDFIEPVKEASITVTYHL